MSPIDLLTAEHKLVERMVAAMQKRLNAMASKGELDMELVDLAVDFIRTYADCIHEGKEERIFFRTLESKPISAADGQAIKDLIAEHAYVRQRTTLLVAARELYLEGSRDALKKVTDVMGELLRFYPDHVQREEKNLFAPAGDYLSDQDKAGMLEQMQEFDRNVMHEKYRRLVEALEGTRG